jgi:hypothetical protein
MMDIAIIVAAFNRPHSLQRLLGSILKAFIGVPVSLYISIDGKGAKEVIEIAHNYVWPFGSKKIIVHQENLGLHKHILSCGDLSEIHDGIIILEDDLFVASNFYNFAFKAMGFYKPDDRIAGISLYTHCFNETAETSFMPLNDGSSVFFMQLASSWGQCFSREQWAQFKSWYDNNKRLSREQLYKLPPNVAKWPESSWKKYFISYMVENDLYFVYPRNSYSTNFGDKGVNLNNDDHFQVPLNYGKDNIRFCSFLESRLKYDSYCEILPCCLNTFDNSLAEFNYTVDLYGNKPIRQVTSDYILSSRSSSNPIHSFARKMIPHETNIIAGILGNDIAFSHILDINKSTQGYSNERVVYYHRLPRWHLKAKSSGNDKPVPLNENEETLLRIHTNKIGKLLLKPIFFLHRLYILLRNLL